MLEGVETTTSEPSPGGNSGCRQTGCAGCLFLVVGFLLSMGFVNAALDYDGSLTGATGSLLFLLPTLAGSGLALLRWSNSQTPLSVLKWTLLIALTAVPFVAAAHFSRPLGESLLIGLAAPVFVMFAWFPQVALALFYFHRRPSGGVTLSRRFSLRTFFVGFALLSVLLAGVGTYVNAVRGPAYSGRSYARFDPRHWPALQGLSADDGKVLARRLNQKLKTHITTMLEARGYDQVPLPSELRWHRSVYNPDAPQQEYELEYYRRQLPDEQQVYVLLKSEEGVLIETISGFMVVTWGERNPYYAVSPATNAEMEDVQRFLRRLARAIYVNNPHNPLAELESRIEQITLERSPADGR